MSRLMIFRPSARPSLALPLNVRSVGHYHLESGRRESRNPGTFLQLFWCLQGSGKIRLGKKFQPFRPHTVFLYQAGEPHHLESGKGRLEYRWLTLDGLSSQKIPERFGLNKIQLCGRCPENLFDQLPACLQDSTALGERQASVIAYEILLLAGAARGNDSEPTPTIHQAKIYLEQHFRDARLNIGFLADHFQIHRSTLYRLFLRHHGVSPVQYLNRLRIGHALHLLKEKSLPVADVAVRSGLPDLAYFSRQIRRNTGFSPRDYRNRYS